MEREEGRCWERQDVELCAYGGGCMCGAVHCHEHRVWVCLNVSAMVLAIGRRCVGDTEDTCWELGRRCVECDGLVEWDGFVELYVCWAIA